MKKKGNIMSKILVYRMTHDSGFAPNPFGRYLTLVACTPNHMRANLQKGDWIVGLEAKHLSEQRKKARLCEKKEQLIIYVAEVSEVLNLNDYFNDLRFQYKKFQKCNNWKIRRGDNVYYIDNNQWKWIKGHEHNDKYKNQNYFNVNDFNKIWNNQQMKKQYKPLIQDINGNRVFISENFSYFGDKCVSFDPKFSNCVKQSQGIKYCREENKNYKNFLDYLKDLMKNHGTGQKGNPILCHIYDYCKNDKTDINKSC